MSLNALERKQLHDAIAAGLDDLQLLFQPRIKVTFFARDPDKSDGSGNVFVSNDEMNDVINGLTKLRDEPGAFHDPPIAAAPVDQHAEAEARAWGHVDP